MTKYKFDSKTGTMVPVIDTQEQPTKPSSLVSIPISQTNIKNKALNENQKITFDVNDLSTFQIIDESNGNILAVISGYNLDINFNLELLNSTSKVEQCVQGIATLSRKILMEKLLG